MCLSLLSAKHLLKHHSSRIGQEAKEEILNKRERANETKKDT